MKSRLPILLSFFTIAYSIAQENRWNIETNYAVVPAEGLGGENNVFELGFKHRFVQNDIFNFGLSLNGGFFREGSLISGDNGTETNYIVQPRAFSEFKLPFSKRLKPSVGFGYSFLSGYKSRTDSFGGFNLNLGLIYDISDKWFVQFQYDRVSLRAINNPEGFNNFRLGIGFRF